MDLDDSTVYTNETGKHSTLTPLYAILQAKDHEPEMRHPQEAMIDQCKWIKMHTCSKMLTQVYLRHLIVPYVSMFINSTGFRFPSQKI